jgi:Ca2+-transporting ATPase
MHGTRGRREFPMNSHRNFAVENPARVVPVHTAVPGRARFKVAGLHRSPFMKRFLENRLAAMDAIGRVSASELTGNVLVKFDTAYSAEEIAGLIDHAIDGLPTAPSRHNGLARPKPGLAAAPSQKEKIPAWHTMEAGEVIARTASSLRSGLDSASAVRRLREHGVNLLPQSVGRSQLAILLDQFTSTPILLLIAAGAVSILTAGAADAAIILGVVGLNAAIGYATESQSERTIDSLKKVVTPSALVIRDGKPGEIPAYQVVIGDIIVLRPGSYVPADSRLLETDRLSVDESTLTGESLPVNKTAQPLRNPDLPLSDRTNMVYMGTLVTGGQGLAAVVATGRLTEIGRIQMLATEAQAPRTPLQQQLDRMGRQLAVLVGGACFALFGIGLLRGYPLIGMLQTSIALAVSAVPEGLPAIATTILALGIARMRRHGVLVRRLDAVETLGCVGTICLDKTGTLTLNRMAVAAIYAGARNLEVRFNGFWENNRRIQPALAPELERLLEVGVLCSESLIEKNDGGCAVTGSPTENALVNLAIAANLDVMRLRANHPVIKTALRSEDRSFMSTLHRNRTPNGATFLTAVKGSPEQVLAMCTRQLKDGAIVELSPDDRRTIEIENEGMAGRSLRVEPALNGNHNDLIWLGLAGLADPVRRGVAEVIQGFHRAGIDTVMITGDQSPTAYAIGSELGLSRNGALEIVDSAQLANLDPEILKGLAQRVDVFARVSPAYKLQIVRALQQAGKVVAMTGDGINDGPALKAADIGIAMGTAGTDVAREVADVVLEDDELQTMLVAVEQGRTIYNNIRKAVHFLLSTNFSEVIVTFAAMTAGLGQPLTAIQLLWINLITDTSLGLALALEPPQPELLQQPPRDPNEPIVGPADLRRIAFESLMLSAGALGAYGYGALRYGLGPRTRTLGFTALVGGQILHAFPSRLDRSSIFDLAAHQSNPLLTLTVAGSLALQAAVFFIAPLRKLLGVTPIGLADGLVIGAGALAPLLINQGVYRRTET